EMGQAIRITLALRRDFWAEQQQLSQAAFIHSDDPFLPTWWTSLDSAASLLTADSSKALTGWAGGPKAESLSRLSDAELADRAIQSLARILSVKREAIEARLVRWYVHNWSKDQFARGAYSYARVGGLEARRLLAAPLENTLYFAGEAADTYGYSGTVHGALASGHRTARLILGS